MMAKTNEYLGKAYETLTNISADEKKRLEYEAREKAIRDYNHQMKSNWKAGHEQGITLGIKQGESLGEKRMGRLTEILLEAERLEDLKRATSDVKFREQLFKEFDIQN